ncbi:hypothetical protein C882_2856 [Caenispirillum salinarum AK4]|uniref:DUF429 domain-containing protein n=1 Tax=Caenispirillum salinarum AK4 TaxID=1238182 RepID=K9H6N9_9PROT|nr:DUF429 domain-containing protein [Caenispirillum salinarum]EKV26278.1 hypothetical protein C882_2856 [Caenispirillum salinarum AK4]
MTRDSGAVLGIDVGWAPNRKSSAVCRLEWTQDAVSWRIVPVGVDLAERRAVVVDMIGPGADVCAIDGPIHGSLEIMDRYRLPERLLTRGFQRIGKPGQSSSPQGRRLNQEATVFAALVLDTGCLGPASFAGAIHDRALVEAFPTSFLGTMLEKDGVPEHGQRSDVYYAHLLGTAPAPPQDRLAALLEDLLPGRACLQRPAEVRDHDERAALVCALTALSVARGRYVAVGDAADGFITLGAHTRPWAVAQLRRNAEALGRSETVLDRSK